MEDEVVKGPVVVTGASGFIGSWLVMRLLEQGYTVRATVRDPYDEKKIKHLLELPKAEHRLTLWKADLDVEGSYDEVSKGSEGVFHLATPMDFESSDPENEVIKPTVNGMLDVMRSCKKGGSVKRVIFTTSAGTVNVMEHQLPVYDETCWSDLDFINRVKMTGWMYFVSKILAERAAWEFAEENGLDFVSIVPTLVVGPFITASMPPSLITALAVVTGNESHYSILKQVQLVHLDDLCRSLIFLYEHPEAHGRYICSSHDTTIVAIAKMLKGRYPEYQVPTKFEGIEDDIAPVRFSSKKLTGMGFKFQYSMEDMYDGAIESCREKNLLFNKTVDDDHGSCVAQSTQIPNGSVDPSVPAVAAV